MNMGFMKPKAGPSAEEIRTQEEARIKQENLTAIQESESKRSLLRSQALGGGGDDDKITRKKLLGE